MSQNFNIQKSSQSGTRAFNSLILTRLTLAIFPKTVNKIKTQFPTSKLDKTFRRATSAAALNSLQPKKCLMNAVSNQTAVLPLRRFFRPQMSADLDP